MKNEFILHFSAIPIARLVPPPEKGGPVTGSLRDLYTLEWGAEHPVTPAEAARLKALAKLDAVEILSRLEEYEAALSGEGEAVSAAVGEYRRGRDGYWRQRRVKFPANVLLEGGRAVQQGTHKELLEQPGLYQRIYRIQSLVAEEVENETREEQL